MGKIKIAIIGAGVRGRYIYGDFIKNNQEIYEIVAVVENKIGRRKKFKEIFNLPEDKVFENINDFFEKEKIADAVIICSGDNTHFLACERALEKGYDVLIESPVTNSLDKLVNLKDICEKNKDKVFMAAMPYRYSSFFEKLKDIINQEQLGKLININYNCNIGYEKFVHYYVRGSWRLDSDTAPILLTNNCYDLDMLEYLTNSQCEIISSFGNLNHFKRENLQINMSQQCIRCSIDDKCPYYSQRIYSRNKNLSKYLHINPTEDNINEILKEGQYGQCVYSCDNNVSDNIICILKYKNNVTASLNISAFTKEESKNIRLMFTHGEVYGNINDNTISIKKFISNEETIIKVDPDNMDERLIKDFFNRVKTRNNNDMKSSVLSTLNNHATAFAGEFASVSESVVNVENFYREAVKMTKSIEKLFL